MLQVSIRSTTRTIYLVEEGPNPSTDYFLIPALNGVSMPIIRCGWSSPLPSAQDLANATVIFVRYVPTGWKRLINQTRFSLAELIYFMDDDLWDVRAAAGLSWMYRFKLARHATRHQYWLKAVQATLWVSSKWLANKYTSLQPQLVMPAMLESTPSSEANSTSAKTHTLQLFYHGSASHRADIDWLYPVIKAVLARNTHLQFEIIGDTHTQAL